MTTFRATDLGRILERPAVLVAVGIWLLVDLLRVWAPSLITIFGQAASTPAELMGAFALAVILAGGLPLLAVRFTGISEVTMLAAMLASALGCRVALQIVGGSSPQLWLASIGLACAVAWTALATRCLGGDLVEGYALGLAAATISHAILGTWGAVWRADGWGWGLLIIQVAVAIIGMRALWSRRASPAIPASRALALVLLPSYLLVGIWAASPARAGVVAEHWGSVIVALGALLTVFVARAGALGRAATATAGAILVGGTAVILLPASASAWTLPAYLLGLPALMVLLSALGARRPTSESGHTPMFAAAGGAVLWVVLFFVYYAGYDLGYRADIVLVVLSLVIAGLAVAAAPGGRVRERSRPDLRVAFSAGVVVVVLALLGPAATVRPVGPQGGTPAEGLTVLAWNLRMGYGMDGTFAPDAVAELIAGEHPDVVLLSEIDRGWLLNGGQDQLRILARLLGMTAHFGPAADPVWGDAILTNLDVAALETRPLPSYGAVTGAQALAARITHDGLGYEVVSTHVQPHSANDGEDGSLAQARDIAEFAWSRIDPAAPVPLIVGGDFNLEPGDPSWQALLDSGLRDALAEVRPVPTSPADDPVDEIDHVFVSGDVRVVEAGAIGMVPALSDHLPVVITLEPTG